MVVLLYNILLYLSALILVPYYIIRGIRYGKARRGIRERLGLFSAELLSAVKERDVIWVHAVSVGETRAALPLLKALRKEYPDALLLLSNVTETGRKVATNLKEVDQYIFFPFDLSWIVKKALNAIKPKMIVLVETEIWPNFVLEAKKQQIPLVLVNGRISDRSFPRYRMAGKIFVPILDSISDFCMQSEQDSRRIRRLGAASGRVQVTGNLKFDMQAPDIDSAEVLSLKERYKLPEDAVVWVAGSTHEGEDTLLAEVYLRLRTVCKNLFLVLVPRHPERCKQVFDDLAKQNIPAILRSELESINKTFAPGDVMIVDTVGEMLKLYAVSDLVFVGGSLVPTGGHNILEASLMKKPVLYGPHMQNFKEIARLVRAAHAGLQVQDADDLYLQMKILLENPSEAERIGDNGNHLLHANQGATQKTLAVISRYL